MNASATNVSSERLIMTSSLLNWKGGTFTSCTSTIRPAWRHHSRVRNRARARYRASSPHRELLPRAILALEKLVLQYLHDPLVAVRGGAKVGERDVLVVAVRHVDRARPEQIRRPPRRHRGNVGRKGDDGRRKARYRTQAHRRDLDAPLQLRTIADPLLQAQPHLVRRPDDARHQPRLGARRDDVVRHAALQLAYVHRPITEQLVLRQLERVELREEVHELARRGAAE